MQSLDDIATWFTQPNIGTCETAAAPFWRILVREQPTARIAIIRRPVEGVLASLARQGVGGDTVAALVRACDRKLDQIERRVPGVLSVRFDDLEREDVCAALFSHCLGQTMPSAWWRAWRHRNVSGNLAAQVRYCHAYLPRILKLARLARSRMFADMARPATPPDGFVIAEEYIEDWFRDAVPLIHEHITAIGQDEDDYQAKNVPMFRKLGQIGAMQVMTARSNGRLFGHLMTVIGPSLESIDRTEALHLPFFVSRDAPVGLGLKLQRAAIDRLREKGVDEVFGRAGVRGAGPRLGVMYRRLGYEDFGTMHRLDLTARV